MIFPNVRIVLVETSHPGNIGASARAMKNMAITNLVLVSPQRFPDEQALFRAVSALDVVNEAKVVDSVEEAIVDCQLVIGTSARGRRIPWPMLDPKGCGEKVVAESGEGHEVAILFGREDRGLSNQELQQCHFHVNIPTGEAYSSLNLAMAVQVICYEVLQAKLAGAPEQSWDMDYASSADMERLYEHLEETLIQVGFHDPDNPRQLMTRLRRLFNRIRPDQMEISILRGILSSINRLDN
ncbi:MAG: tRNA (cytosine(32)/uridine(32)-2'-O)-methyltransferase TrmJ [Gammaproteobacteria bacterium]|nr:tRNA (cytosine(32)/uridine(32)-2'-O)-methyltransferase TrmJ [Gammaproteobacteria bacterium]